MFAKHHQELARTDGSADKHFLQRIAVPELLDKFANSIVATKLPSDLMPRFFGK